MSAKARKRRTRKQRRRVKSVMSHGKAAVRKHKRPSGRTGSIFAKLLGSRNVVKNRQPDIAMLGKL